MKKIIILVLCLALCACTDYAELNTLSIVTAVSIDKEKDNYKMAVLIANSPKAQTTSKEGEAKTTVYEAKGKTIAEVIKLIDKKTPKKLYFSHINVVIISEEIGKEGFLKTADWLMRHPQTRNRFYLMQVKNDKASDVLKIISPLESFPSQSIATLIESSQNAKANTSAASYSNFIGRVLEKGYDPIMPTIIINGSVKKGSKQENLETAMPNTYLSLGPIAIYKKDKLIATSTRKETEMIQLINGEAKELTSKIKYKNITANIFAENIKSKISLKDKNKIEIKIKMLGNIYEINGNINIDNPKNIKKLEKKWSKTLKKDIKKLINKTTKKYKTDIFGFGNLIYKNHPKKWKKIKNNYLSKLDIKVKVDTSIISTGSLTKTLKEGEK